MQEVQSGDVDDGITEEEEEDLDVQVHPVSRSVALDCIDNLKSFIEENDR